MLMEGRREESSRSLLHIKVEPSIIVSPGLFVDFNEEFKAPADGVPEGDTTASAAVVEGAQWVPDCLVAHWDASMRYAENAAEQLASLVKQ
jgi:hypothetical protein